MTPEEHLHALHRQVQYLLEQQQYMNEHCAAASHAQYWADRCFTAETATAAGKTNLMSAKLRELMLKHVYYAQRTDGLVRL